MGDGGLRWGEEQGDAPRGLTPAWPPSGVASQGSQPSPAMMRTTSPPLLLATRSSGCRTGHHTATLPPDRPPHRDPTAGRRGLFDAYGGSGQTAEDGQGEGAARTKRASDGSTVGPRFCLNPIKIFGGSFGGPTLFKNPFYVSPNQDGTANILGGKKVAVVFVLGGPGSGKGTKCSNIVEHFGFTHLSAGELLRSEIKSGSENGTMIDCIIKEEKIVPSKITIKLLQEAMIKSENDKFLIDGFPRNQENCVSFENVIKISPEFVLFFDCSEEEMVRRLLGRNQGRADDNIETIRKRFRVFVESSLPVVQYYESKGKFKKINAAKPIVEVFEDVKPLFQPYGPKVTPEVRLELRESYPSSMPLDNFSSSDL